LWETKVKRIKIRIRNKRNPSMTRRKKESRISSQTKRLNGVNIVKEEVYCLSYPDPCHCFLMVDKHREWY